MSIFQISKIQLRRGRKNSDEGVPQLASAEMAWAVDTQELFIGNGAVSEGSPTVGNTRILTEPDLKVFQNEVDELSTRVNASNAGAIDSTLQSEITRAINAETSLQDQIDLLNESTTSASILVEKTRALLAEFTITSSLNTEKTRALAAEATLTSNLNSEITRATNAEATLTANLNAESSLRYSVTTTLDGRITAESDRLDDEINRAFLAESSITTSVLNEFYRAVAVETTLTTNLNSEITRATNAESTLTANLNAEITRATNAETTNAANILVEKTRALAAESTLTTAVNDLIANPIIVDNSVTTPKILDANVTTSKIANANVTLPKLGTDVIDEMNNIGAVGGFGKEIYGSGNQGYPLFVINNKPFLTGVLAGTIGRLVANGDYSEFLREIPFNKPHLIPSGVTVVDAAASCQSFYVVLSNGWVYSIGVNTHGQLGHGDLVRKVVLTRIEYFVTNGISIDKVWATTSYYNGDGQYGSTWFRATNGNLYACGNNANGNLGIGNITTPISTPTQVLGITNVTHFSASAGAGAHCIAVSSNNPNQVWTWGYNLNGNLGTGNTVNANSPAVRYTDPSNPITKVFAGAGAYFNGSAWENATGGWSSYFLVGGEVYSCGYNADAQLGLGDTVQRTSFTKITSVNGIADFACQGGRFSTLYLLTLTGNLYACGFNQAGNTGDGTLTSPRTAFFLAKTGVASVKCTAASSYGQALCLDTDGYLWGAGTNHVGTLGLGQANFDITGSTYKPVSTFSPVVSPIGKKVVDYHLFAFVGNRFDSVAYVQYDDGSLYAMGRNYGGILSIPDFQLSSFNPAIDCPSQCMIPYQ